MQVRLPSHLAALGPLSKFERLVRDGGLSGNTCIYRLVVNYYLTSVFCVCYHIWQIKL